MSTPTTQTQLGADLSIKAVGEGIGEALKSADVRAAVDASDINKATESMRALARWQMEQGILVSEAKAGDKGYTYRIDPTAISALTDDDQAKGAALYADAVEKTVPLIPALYTHGKSAYVQYFSETHRDVDALMEPPVQRATEATMDNVAAASLAFVDAMARNPDQAGDIAGVTRLDIEAMTDRLAQAGYLVPGENPGRDNGSLSEQTPRGTYEDKLAIYELATSLASNAKEPATFQGIHAPVLALRNLESTIANGEIEERAVFGGAKAVAPESDLQAEDMDHIVRTALLVAQIANRSQISTDIDDMDSEQPMVIVAQNYTTIDEDGNVVERTDLLEALRAQMAINDEQGLYGRNDKGQLTGVLVRGNRAPEDFHVPDLARNSTETLAAGKALYSLMRAADAMARFEHNPSERASGDDGAAYLAGPHGHKQGEGDEQDAMPLGEFDRAMDLDAEGAEADETEDGVTNAPNTRELELAAERFAQSKGVELEVQEAHMPEAFVDKGTKAIDELSSMGLISKLSQLSGREQRFGEHDAAILNGSTTTHFASLDDFSAGGDSASKPRSFDPDVLSFGMVDRKGGKTKEDLAKTGAVRVDSSNKLFHGYRNGSSSTAQRRVKEFIGQKLTSDDNGSKEAFRGALRRMVERPVIAETLQEAQAWRDQAKAFVERDNEEHRMRLEAMAAKADAKAGLWSIDIPRDQATRMVHVLQAGGKMQEPVFVALMGDTAKFYNNESPVITASIGAQAPDEVRANKSERVLGGTIKPYQLETALQNADPKDTRLMVFMAGEVPRGATSEIVFKNKETEKTKAAAKPRGIEADLPDVLG
jgi:hypothetical protein